MKKLIASFLAAIALFSFSSLSYAGIFDKVKDAFGDKYVFAVVYFVSNGSRFQIYASDEKVSAHGVEQFKKVKTKKFNMVGPQEDTKTSGIIIKDRQGDKICEVKVTVKASSKKITSSKPNIKDHSERVIASDSDKQCTVEQSEVKTVDGNRAVVVYIRVTTERGRDIDTTEPKSEDSSSE